MECAVLFVGAGRRRGGLLPHLVNDLKGLLDAVLRVNCPGVLKTQIGLAKDKGALSGFDGALIFARFPCGFGLGQQGVNLSQVALGRGIGACGNNGESGARGPGGGRLIWRSGWPGRRGGSPCLRRLRFGAGQIQRRH